jgi:hypothetical protein
MRLRIVELQVEIAEEDLADDRDNCLRRRYRHPVYEHIHAAQIIFGLP